MTIRGEPSSGPAAARPGRITPGGSRPCGSGHGRSHTRYGSGAKVPGDARALGVQRLRHAFAVAGQVLADPLEFAPPALALEAEQLFAGLVRQRDAGAVPVFRPRQRADRGVDRADTGRATGTERVGRDV